MLDHPLKHSKYYVIIDNWAEHTPTVIRSKHYLQFKELGFPFFMKATPDQIPLTNAIGFSEKEIDMGIDEDNYVGDFVDDYDNDGQSYDDDDANPEFVSTSMGRLHLKTAEAIYLNGGKSTFTSKSRKSRFYKNCFSEKSDLKAYNTQSFCCSGQGIVKVGSKQRLPGLVT